MYHDFSQDVSKKKTYVWFGLYREENEPKWDNKTSPYFRFKPNSLSLFLIVIMSLLNTINSLFLDDKTSKELKKQSLKDKKKSLENSFKAY